MYLPVIGTAARQYIMVKEILQFGAVNPCMVVDDPKTSSRYLRV